MDEVIWIFGVAVGVALGIGLFISLVGVRQREGVMLFVGNKKM